MHQFLIHNKTDHVGVAVRDIKTGDTVIGVFMDDDSTIEVISNGDIPLGHKIAIANLPPNADVLKYNVKIGHTPAGFKVGDYVHTHNIRTSRW